ncbi:unnamed protein product [Rangifer tarandus platyrhynchus]|uniref:Uncharacterized protein n=2 Tax=Rangifer tarandus platyrhynchus TaxID=3082113 RepID=A0ACB0EXH9_RANTA|nr:unnamed protein product [Rangifer tarandus platyrhynchus]CAI9704849.1 unnamed protein product [Rangifer tarandus platyrhynchus]
MEWPCPAGVPELPAGKTTPHCPDPRQQQKLAPAPGSDHRGPNGYTAEMGFRARVWHVDLRDVEPRQGRRPQSGPLLQS